MWWGGLPVAFGSLGLFDCGHSSWGLPFASAGVSTPLSSRCVTSVVQYSWRAVEGPGIMDRCPPLASGGHSCGSLSSMLHDKHT